MKGATEYENHIIVNNNNVYGANIDGTFISLEHIPTMSRFRGFGIQVPEYPDDIDWAVFDSVVKLCENGKNIFARFKKKK